MTVLVSFCVFGSDPDDIYYEGALKNAAAYLKHFPDWVCRFYLGKTALKPLGSQLSVFPNVEIVAKDDIEDQSATFWRFLAAKDGQHDWYLFRDVDSRPIQRERVAVQEWVGSSAEFHVMRDHPFHGVPMLAGMWGVSREGAAKIAHMIPSAIPNNHYQVDQQFLAANVWRTAKRSLMSHVDCRHDFGTENRPFMIPFTLEGFVGQGFYGNDKPRFPLHNRLIVG